MIYGLSRFRHATMGVASAAMLGSFALGSGAASAQGPATKMPVDKFHITDAERAACQQDVMLLCSDTFPDEDQLLACMRQKRQLLTPTCLSTFDAGLKRRHLRM